MGYTKPLAIAFVLIVASSATAEAILTPVDPSLESQVVVSGLNIPAGLALGPGNNLYASVSGGVVRISFDAWGSATVHPFGTVSGLSGGITTDALGNVYLTDGNTITTDNVYKLAAGTGAVSILTNFNHPTDIKLSPSGTLFISQRFDGQVVEVDPVTGATLSLISTGGTPTGIAFDAAGNLYIGRRDNGAILKATFSGGSLSSLTTLTTVAPNTTHLGLTYDPAFDDLIGHDSNTGGIFRIDLDTGLVTDFASLTNVATTTLTIGDISLGGGPGSYFVSSYQTGEIFRLAPRPVPEPATAILFGVGLIGYGVSRRRRARSRSRT